MIRAWETLGPDKAKEIENALARIGVTVEVEFNGGSPTSVIINGPAGPLLRFAHETYSMTIQRLKPAMVKRWVVSGTVRGLKVSEEFDEFEPASERKHELACGQGADEPSMKCEEKEVEVRII